MSILIKGMEMPKDEGDSIHILRDETAVIYRAESIDFYKAIPVSPHGRLIDADELFKEMERKGWFDNADRDKAEDIVLSAPTIIEEER